MLLLLPRRGARRQSHRRGYLETEEQAENYRYYMQTYMPNLIGYDWSPDQFAGDDFITGARGTTYYFRARACSTARRTPT